MLENPANYRVFTRRFDRVVLADNLATRPVLERAWVRFMDDTLELRTIWDMAGSRLAGRLRSAVTESVFRDTIVTLLVDQSGSMRGARVLMAAAAVDVVRSFLVQLGVSVEVLGFTTRSWKGGWSRRFWRWSGRRKHPGRLCDLLHIVYADASNHRPGSGTRSLMHMLDPKLLKENVDGEAMLWAAERQDRHQYTHKVIVLISDGAPVDDSTLHENGPNYLVEHLQDVIARLQVDRVLAQLKIGDEAESDFGFSRKVYTISDIGPTLLDLLGEVLAKFVTKEASDSGRQK
jgi:cobaltochelatase CobT